ncbi:MAG: ABC transporter permease [Bacteroidota bacterium]
MLRNYLKITLRTVQRNKVYAGLNILGLALGMAASIFILQYVSYERSYDQFHSRSHDLYRVQYQTYKDGQVAVNSATAVPRIAPFMQENMPEVEGFARAYPLFGVMSTADKQFRETNVYFADPAFLKIFDFKLLHGSKGSALSGPDKMVITESAALKYFGESDVIGQSLTFNSWFSFTAEVTAVVADVPDNSHFKFDFLISYQTLNNENVDSDGSIASEDSWDWSSFYTYVLLEEGSDPDAFNRKFNKLLLDERGEAFEKNDQIEAFPLQPITDIHLHSRLDREADLEGQGDGQVVFFLSVIAIFILIIAWVNYINLSTARSVDRAKEVGVRKTMGALKGNLVYQFLTESFVFNLIAMALGLVLVTGSIGAFNQVTGSSLSIDFLRDIGFWVMISVVWALGSLFSGLYPSFILSAFKPAKVLKGRFSANKQGAALRKALVVFQFAVSICLIAADNLLVIKGPMVYDEDLYTSSLEAFRHELSRNSAVSGVTASSNIPGDEIIWTNTIRRFEDPESKGKTVSFVGVDYDYFSTYDITLVAGRNFDRSFTSDTGAVILNRVAASLLGFEKPEEALNKKVVLYGDPKTIVGVVDDYKQMSAKVVVSPMVFPLSLDMTYYFIIRSNTDDYQQLIETSKAAFDQLFPGNPYDYFVFEDFFNRLYKSDQKFQGVFTLFTSLAIIIACLGLFGLSSFSMLQRTKEIGIRKVLGATLSSILVLLTKEFIILIGIANLIAWPVIYLVMNQWLDNFVTRIPIGISIFMIAGVLAILVALLTVGLKSLRTARSNPIDALRYE